MGERETNKHDAADKAERNISGGAQRSGTLIITRDSTVGAIGMSFKTLEEQFIIFDNKIELLLPRFDEFMDLYSDGSDQYLKRAESYVSYMQPQPSGVLAVVLVLLSESRHFVYDLYGRVRLIYLPDDNETMLWMRKLVLDGWNFDEMPSGLIPTAGCTCLTEKLRRRIEETYGYRTLGTLLFDAEMACKSISGFGKGKLERLKAYGAVEDERLRASWTVVMEGVISAYRRLDFFRYPIDRGVFVPYMSIAVMLEMGADHTEEEYAARARELYLGQPDLVEAIEEKLRARSAKAIVDHRFESNDIVVMVSDAPGWNEAACNVAAEYPYGKCTYNSKTHTLTYKAMSLREWLEANLTDEELEFFNEQFRYRDVGEDKPSTYLMKHLGSDKVLAKVEEVLRCICHVKENNCLHYYQSYSYHSDDLLYVVDDPQLAIAYYKVVTRDRRKELRDKLAMLKCNSRFSEEEEKEIAKLKADLMAIDPETKLDRAVALEDMNVPERVKTNIALPQNKKGIMKEGALTSKLKSIRVQGGWYRDPVQVLTISRFKEDEKMYKPVK